jgi:hypothetical protein
MTLSKVGGINLKAEVKRLRAVKDLLATSKNHQSAMTGDVNESGLLLDDF